MSTPLPETAAQTSPQQPWPIRVLTIKIGNYLKRMPPVWTEGQVVEISRRGDSKLAFMTLRDPVVDMSQAVVVHRQVLDAMPTPLVEGARVVARLVPDYYDARGLFRLRAVDLKPVGIGELLAQVEHLRRLLAAEGVFDPSRKKPLPFAPAVIGLVCGRDSDAEHDVVVNTGKRWPGTRFEIRRVPVQGTGAASAVAEAVRGLDADPAVEVIVVARGGGSLEDLLPFSNEALIRAVAACRTPLVSAIGHEADSPLLDLVADVRASTPTDAARLLVPDAAAQRRDLAGTRAALRAATARALGREQESLAGLRARLAARDPAQVLADGRLQVADHRRRARHALRHRFTLEDAQVGHLRARLRAMSPQATLDRGYAIVLDEAGRVVTASDQTSPGARLDVVLGRGRAVVEVADVVPADPPG